MTDAEKEKKNQELFAAVAADNAEAVQKLLKAGSDVNAKDSNGATALMIAAADSENPNIVKMLLKAGADVNARDSKGATALMYNLEGPIESAVMLIEAGADVNAKNINGTTALMDSVKEGRYDMVELLLNKGANIHYADKKGKTSIEVATQQGHTKIESLLIKESKKQIEKHALEHVLINQINDIRASLAEGYKVKNSIEVAAQEEHANIESLLTKKSKNKAEHYINSFGSSFKNKLKNIRDKITKCTLDKMGKGGQQENSDASPTKVLPTKKTKNNKTIIQF